MTAPARIEKKKPTWTIKRKLIVLLSVVLLIAGLLLGWKSVMHYRFERARASWKDIALSQLAGLSSTNAEIQLEFDQLKKPAPNLDFGWAHEHMLMMTNGEYLIYAFRHGFNNGFVDHLFLARGSDDKWYYSTYHFCNHMVAIMSDDPPDSIVEFTKRYWVREFDGKSDKCLQRTWHYEPPASYQKQLNN